METSLVRACMLVIYTLLFDIPILLACECFRYDHHIEQCPPTTELSYRVKNCFLIRIKPVYDNVCTNLQLLSLREWVESVKVLCATCRQATSNKKGSTPLCKFSLCMKEAKKSKCYISKVIAKILISFPFASNVFST